MIYFNALQILQGAIILPILKMQVKFVETKNIFRV